jgi:hypothetical protein
LEKGSVGIQVREVRKVDKGRRKISALLSFVSFSKLVILVYTGQPVENNTAYARYTKGLLKATTFMDIAMIIILIKVLNENIEIHSCYRKLFSVFPSPYLGVSSF